MYAYNYSSTSQAHHTIWIHFHHQNFPFFSCFAFYFSFSLCLFSFGSLWLFDIYNKPNKQRSVNERDKDSNMKETYDFIWVFFSVINLEFSFTIDFLVNFGINFLHKITQHYVKYNSSIRQGLISVSIRWKTYFPAPTQQNIYFLDFINFH